MLHRKLLNTLEEKRAEGRDLHELVPADQFAYIPTLKHETTKLSYLHAAVAAAESDQIIYLLRQGFNIETLDEKGRTALTFILECLQRDMKKVTREEIIPIPNVVTPFGPAVQRKEITECKYDLQQIDACILLLKYGAVLSVEQEKFITDHLRKEIDLAACKKSAAIKAKIDVFMTDHIDINWKDDRGETLLSLAMKEEKLDSEEVKTLLNRGADPMIRNGDDKSAMQLMLSKIPLTLTQLSQDWKDILITLIRQGDFSALDKERHLQFMTMGIDVIKAKDDHHHRIAEKVKRAEVLSKENHLDRIELRKDFAGLVGYVKEDGEDLRQKFGAMMGIVGNLCEKVADMQTTISGLQEDKDNMYQTIRGLLEENQRLREQLQPSRNPSLTQSETRAEIGYQSTETRLPFFDRQVRPLKLLNSAQSNEQNNTSNPGGKSPRSK